MKEEIRVDIDFDIRCEDCNKPLEVLIKVVYTQFNPKFEIDVEPCSECLSTSEIEGHSEGYSQALADHEIGGQT